MTKQRTMLLSRGNGTRLVMLLLIELVLLGQCGPVYMPGRIPTPPAGFVQVNDLASGDLKLVGQPSFSADGRLIAFGGSPYLDGGFLHLYVIDLDEGRQEMESQEAFWNAIAISPDGEWIAASGEVSDEYPGRPLYLIDIESTTASRLTEGNLPAWSPDGALIAYVRQTSSSLDRDCRQQIWVYTLSTKSETKVFDTNCVGSYFDDLTWSPDQTALAYRKDLEEIGTDEHGTAIYLFSIDSGNTRIVSGDTRFASSPNFSPDGDRILYRDSPEIGSNYLAVIDLSTGQCHRVTTPVSLFFEVRLSPDGDKIAFVQDHGILVADINVALGPDFWTVGEPCSR